MVRTMKGRRRSSFDRQLGEDYNDQTCARSGKLPVIRGDGHRPCGLGSRARMVEWV